MTPFGFVLFISRAKFVSNDAKTRILIFNPNYQHNEHMDEANITNYE